MALQAQSPASKPRITAKIDETQLVTLTGNTHPAAQARYDQGPVEGTLRMSDLILVLSRSADQQAAFDKFVESQYEPSSPNYHQWLTPAQIGEKFGPSLTDIATVSNWLAGHGFSVDQVANDRMSIRFSGTAAQVESTFHTDIHNLLVKGESHIGNMSDPQIPAALAPVVLGVKSLHNFFPKPLHRLGGMATRDVQTGSWKRATSLNAAAESVSTKVQPDLGITVGSGSSAYQIEDVTPYDFATIYNVLPLWNASTPIDGTGQVIAIAGTSSVRAADVASFRSTFGLPTSSSVNTPIFKSGNSSPVTICTDTTGKVPFSTNACELGDQQENALDVEWSGAVAKNAQIVLVSSYPASTSDDTLYDSESYIINNSVAKIMNVSYGLCELGMGTSGNKQYANLWQTAAAAGIAVFVATGDSGSPACDQGLDGQAGTPWAAQYGVQVNGLASTPYDTAVGGTDFNWTSSQATYWASSNNSSNGSNALGYIPETPWNDTCTNPFVLKYLQSWATSLTKSGQSATSPTDADSACNFVETWWKYIFQNTTSNTDISWLVDTVGAGGGMSSCITGDGSTVASCTGGYAKPNWQTSLTPADNARDIPDVSFFASNGFQGSAYLVCVSDSGSCVNSTQFNNLTAEPSAQEIGGTSVATPAMAGVMALINQKAGASQGSPNAVLYQLAAKQTYSQCSAETVTASSSSCYFNDPDKGTNAMPCDYGASEGGLQYNSSGSAVLVTPIAGIKSTNCNVASSSDTVGVTSGYSATTGFDLATGLGSLNVANVVNGWTTITSAGLPTPTITVQPASINIGVSQSLAVTVSVVGSNGTTPTGNVTLSGGGYTSSAVALSSGAASFTIPASTLSLGSDTLTASYSGDSNYAAGTGAVTIAVSNGSYGLSATTPSAIAAGGTATSTVTVSSTNGYSGTVTLACSLTSSPTGATNSPTCSVGSTVTLSSSSTSGTATVTFSTTKATASLERHGFGWEGIGGGTVLALVAFLGIPARRRAWRAMLGMLAVLAVIGGMSACGGGGSSGTGTSGTPGTTAGAYTFTVTGTGSPALSSNPTTTITLTVQ